MTTALPDTDPFTADGGHDALAADGAIVRIRPVVRADRAELAELYQRTSDENLYRRFMTGGRAGIDPELDRLTRPADPSHVAVLARERDRVVGVASYERLPDPYAAEFAILVDDAAHGRGVGRLAEELPEVAELDLNPVLAGPDGVVAVDVKLRLAPVDAEPDPGVRALREPA